MPAASQICAKTANVRSSTASRTLASPSGISSVQEPRLRPAQVTWEMTRAFSWKAPSARPARNLLRNTSHFSTAEAFHLVDEIAAMHVPVLALTGGDPLTRLDLFPIIEFAARRSVRTSLTLLPTPLLEPAIISQLKACGLLRLGLWLHGSTPALNDSHWGISGLYRRTLDVIGTCHEVQLPEQVNTILSRRNILDLESMIELLTRHDVV